MKSFVLTLFLGTIAVATCQAQTPDNWWPAAVEAALQKAGDNHDEMHQALRQTPKDQREGMAFLFANMPTKDLRSLKAKFLLDNVALAYKAKEQTPWGKALPKDVFFNHVLPYANINEERDPWRKEFFDMCMPIIKDCKTPSEAAHKLNSTVFKKINLRFSTKRNKPHQSPKESMAIGMASCTGLSIVLSDACRAVAVPARLVGTPQWVSVRGNHTWVEIWDNGWHFTGACEPSGKGLNHAWFAGRAAQAVKDSKNHAIYAASFRKTDINFPLVWDLRNRDVFAENVTDRYAKPRPAPKKEAPEVQKLKKAAQDFFSADPKQQEQFKFASELDELLLRNPKQARDIIWQAYRAAPIHAAAKKDFDAKNVRYEKHLSPYTVKTVGKRPKNGWPLFIAMHGGGGVPKKVNDSQWTVMQRYYKDQDSVTGYKYLALRAPNDTWNGFYTDYVPPLVTNLIRNFLLFGDVDSDKVFLMGYSHGGYGAFYIGPKIPFRFAAVHASAAAPTAGTISPRSLLNTRFTFMIGEHDKAYGRRKRCEQFNDEIQKLKKESKHGYPVQMEFKQGHAHTRLPDRDKIKAMYSFTRNATPKHVIWDLTDNNLRDFFWLHTDNPKRGATIDVRLNDNWAEITTKDIGEFDLCLDHRLVEFGGILNVNLNGKKDKRQIRPSCVTLCRSIIERGDPGLAYSCRVRLKD